MKKHKETKDLFLPATELELRQRRIKGLMEVCPGDFFKFISKHRGIRIEREDLQIKKSHPLPRKLSPGMMCVCVFLFDDDGYCLKIAKARTQRQIDRQYDPKVSGSFAETSLKRLPNAIGSSNVGGWLRKHTIRFDFIIPKKHGNKTLAILEYFLLKSLYHVF